MHYLVMYETVVRACRLAASRCNVLLAVVDCCAILLAQLAQYRVYDMQPGNRVKFFLRAVACSETRSRR